MTADDAPSLPDDAPALVDDDRLGDERAVLTTMLDVQRVILLRKAHGLDHAQLHTPVGSSSLTIGGLLNHMALVEDVWFDHRFTGGGEREPWASAPWDDDRDWEFSDAPNVSGDELRARLTEAIERSRATTAAADLDEVSALERNGQRWHLRWILVHMIEEYARHNGHADLIRESIDGVTGD